MALSAPHGRRWTSWGLNRSRLRPNAPITRDALLRCRSTLSLKSMAVFRVSFAITIRSLLLNDKPSLEELLEVQAYFRLPAPALVEKDWYVVKALAAADIAPFRLVFGGGTALARANKLVRRMSEDIDLKIVADEEPKRSALRRLRDTVTKALLASGFRFDPENPDQRRSQNESHYTVRRLRSRMPKARATRCWCAIFTICI